MNFGILNRTLFPRRIFKRIKNKPKIWTLVSETEPYFQDGLLVRSEQSLKDNLFDKQPPYSCLKTKAISKMDYLDMDDSRAKKV